jgi:hypothetical protein
MKSRAPKPQRDRKQGVFCISRHSVPSYLYAVPTSFSELYGGLYYIPFLRRDIDGASRSDMDSMTPVSREKCHEK